MKHERLNLTDTGPETAVFAADGIVEGALRLRVEQCTKDLRELATEISLVEQRERRRLAEDLHDELVQLLCAAKLKLDRFASSANSRQVRRAIAESRVLVERAERRARTLCFELDPPVLDGLDFLPVVDWLCEEVRQRYDVQVTVEHAGACAPMSEAVRSVAFRAVRELLINVAKHAPARAAVLRTSCGKGRLVVTVRNADRCPDEPASRVFGSEAPEAQAREGEGAARGAPGTSAGFGLPSIAKRLRLLGGELELEGSGRHTVAQMTVPLDAE